MFLILKVSFIFLKTKEPYYYTHLNASSTFKWEGSCHILHLDVKQAVLIFLLIINIAEFPLTAVLNLLVIAVK